MASYQTNTSIRIENITASEADGYLSQWDKRGHDTDAKRWYWKAYTTPGDLLGAIAFYIASAWPPEHMTYFLAMIEPPGGWDEDGEPHHYDGQHKRARYNSRYTPTINEFIRKRVKR